MTASQIAEALGEGVSRNAVIGKAHRLGLQSRPSPVKTSAESSAARAARAKKAAATPKAASTAKAKAAAAPAAAATTAAAPAAAAPVAKAAAPAAPAKRAEKPVPVINPPVATLEPTMIDTVPPTPVPIAPQLSQARMIRPGMPTGPVPPSGPPAPPRRAIPAKPSKEIEGKTSLLDLNDKICRWPLGHPGEPDFHFCGKPSNPGFPYCTEHCATAYQAQLPRRDRKPSPPPPFGAPRVR